MKVEEVNQLDRIENISIEGSSYTFETLDFATEIEVEHYLEEFIPNDEILNQFNSRIRKIDKISPIEEKFSQDVVAFRYYDRIEVNIDGECFTTKRRNFTSKIYLGERLTHEEILERSLTDARLLPIVAEIEDLSSIIICNNGIIITSPEEDAITLSEVKEKKEQRIYKKSIGSQ